MYSHDITNAGVSQRPQKCAHFVGRVLYIAIVKLGSKFTYYTVLIVRYVLTIIIDYT